MNRKGFTLIELLAVVVILGVIMTIAVPNVLSTLDRNKKNTFVENAKTMVTQAEYTLRRDDNVEYPSQKGEAVLLTLAYLNTDDVSESPYSMKYSTSKSFVLVVNSSGNDGRIGDINNDGVTNDEDVKLIQKVINGEVLVTEEDKPKYDVNNDGEITSLDLDEILSYISNSDVTKYNYYVHLVACTDIDCINSDKNSVNRNRGINLMSSTLLNGGKRFNYVAEGSDVKTTLGLVNSDNTLANEDEIKAISGATSIKVFNKID